MRKTIVSLALLGGALALPVFPATAAQDAEVTAEVATIYEQPSKDAAEIDYLQYGTIVRISNEARDGWYKIAIPGRTPVTFGWIAGWDLRAVQVADALDAAGIQRYQQPEKEQERHHLVLAAYAGADYLNPKELQDLGGTDQKSLLAVGFAIDAGYRFATDWTLRFRFAPLSATEELDGGDYELAGTRLALLIDFTFFHSLPFKAGFALGAGQAMSVQATGTVASVDFETEAASILFFPAQLSFNWYPWENLSLILNAGFQYAQSQELTLDGASDGVELDLSAPFAHAGLQVEF